MSMEPGRLAPYTVEEVQKAAREQARHLPEALVAVVGSLLALLTIAFFAVLDYHFNQAPHRLFKILLGATLVVGIALRPRFGLWMFALATPFLAWMPQLGIPGVNPLNVLLFSILISHFLMKTMRGEPALRGGSMGPAVGIMVLLLALSVVRGAAFPAASDYSAAISGVKAFRSAVTFLGYFAALAMVKGERDRRVFGWALIVSLLLEAFVTIMHGRDGSGGRAIGSILQSNDLGMFFALFVVLSAALIPATRGGSRMVMLVATVLGTIGIMMSVSRAAMIAVAVGLMFVSFRSSRWMGALVLLVLVSSPLWAPDYVKERLTSTEVEVQGTDESQLEGGAQLRVDTWSAITHIITEHPLDGVGYNGLNYLLPETGEDLGIEVKDSSHNSFLRFQAELGILGTLIAIYVLWCCFKVALDGMRLATRPFDRQLAVGLGAATLVLTISCAFGDRFFQVSVVSNFWVLCALVDTVRLEHEQKPA